MTQRGPLVIEIYLFIYFILFPYIPIRYIPWKWKTSHSIYIIRQLAQGITSIAKVEKYLSATVQALFDEQMNQACYLNHVNTLRTGDADLRFYISTVQDG